MRRNWKLKSPYIVLETWIMFFSSYNNCKSKVKLWWVGAREKKSAFFVTFIFFEGKSFDYYLRFISMHSVLNKLSEYIYTLIYQKQYFIHFYCLFFKSLKALSVYLKHMDNAVMSLSKIIDWFSSLNPLYYKSKTLKWRSPVSLCFTFLYQTNV